MYIYIYIESYTIKLVCILIFALMYVFVLCIFQAFLKAWEAVCKGGSGGNTKILVPLGKTFMLKPLTFVGPCKSSSVSFMVYITTLLFL